MSDDLKQIAVRLPAELLREAKVDAVRNDETLQEWFKAALEMRLHARRANKTPRRELSNQNV
jgi:predicted HicB family RNase H-like nuclease